jgi:hypothetical protein
MYNSAELTIRRRDCCGRRYAADASNVGVVYVVAQEEHNVIATQLDAPYEQRR